MGRRRRSRSRGRDGRREKSSQGQEKARSRSKGRSQSREKSRKRSRSGSTKKERNRGNDSPSADKKVDPVEASDAAKAESGVKEEAIDKKEEARLKLKELISKNRDKVEDVVRKKEKDGEKEKDLRSILQ